MKPFKQCRNPRSANLIASLIDDLAKHGCTSSKDEANSLDAANAAKGARKEKGDR
jgi:hypothetical protein